LRKVLHINTIDTGGAAIAAIRLHNLLLKNGFESKILFLFRSNKVTIEGSYYFEDLFKVKAWFNFVVKLNILFNRKLTFYKPDIYFNGHQSLFDLSKHPLFEWADVVHLHWVVKFLDWRKVFKHSNKKFLWTFHDMNPFTGGEHYKIGYDGSYSWQSKLVLNKKKQYIVNVDLTVICPSQWLANLVSLSIVFLNKKIVVLRNPIPNDIFKPIDKTLLYGKYPKILPNRIKILFVAENPRDIRKGFDVLLRGLKNINNKEVFQLLIIGKIGVELNLNDINTLEFGEIVDSIKMAEIYNLADYYIIPSLEDNLPNTVSESLLCGTPVIGFNIGGIPEMVLNNKNGFIAENEIELSVIIENLELHLFDSFEVNKYVLTDLSENVILEKYLRLI